MARVTGLEPITLTSKASTLPLSYTRAPETVIPAGYSRISGSELNQRVNNQFAIQDIVYVFYMAAIYAVFFFLRRSFHVHFPGTSRASVILHAEKYK